MRELLAERSHVRNAQQMGTNGDSTGAGMRNGEASKPLAQLSTGSKEKDLSQLVQSVKRKMDQNQGRHKKRSRK
jgi:hypothetical protein